MLDSDQLIVSREKPVISIGFLTEAEGLLVAQADLTSTSKSLRAVAVKKSQTMPSVRQYRLGDSARSLDADLISVTTTKSMGAGVGTFRIEIAETGRYKGKAGFNWEHVLRPNTLVWIDIQRPNLPAIRRDIDAESNPRVTSQQASQPQRVMVGFVDSVTYSSTMSGGKPQRRMSVQGRDVAKLFINAEIKNALAVNVLAQSGNITGPFFLGQVSIGLSHLSKILEEFWKNKLFGRDGDVGQQALRGQAMIDFDLGPKDARIKARDVVKYAFSTPNDRILATPGVQEMSFDGNYFNFFKQMCGLPFNEVFVDTRFDPQNVISPVDHKWGNNAPEYLKTNVALNAILGNAVKKTPVGSSSGVGVSDLFPRGDAQVYGTLFVRPTPFPWRGDAYVDPAGQAGKMFQSSQKNIEAPDKNGMGRWRTLLTHEVRPEDIISYTRSRDDQFVYNWFWVEGRFWYYFQQLIQSRGGNPSVASKYAFNPPIFYTELVKRYGIKFLETSIPFYTISDQAGQEFASDFRYTRRLADYYAFNFIYWSGSLTIKGNPNIRIGEKIYVPTDNREYYIESVTHDFSVFNQFTTTVQIIRGTERGFWGKENKLNNRFFDFDTAANVQIADVQFQNKRVKDLATAQGAVAAPKTQNASRANYTKKKPGIP